MKRIYILFVLILFMGLILTACTTDIDIEENNMDIKNVILDKDVVQENTGNEMEDRNEYAFKVSINGADGFEMISKIYKKGDNSLTEIIKIFGDESKDLPFSIKKMLKSNGKTYQQIEKDNEIFWFSIPGMDSEDDMFNLKEMSKIDQSKVIDEKNEIIDGNKLTCYYISDEISGDGKICLDGDIFAYGEYSENGVKDVIKIEDFENNVKDKIFTIPNEEDIVSTQEMMDLFE